LITLSKVQVDDPDDVFGTDKRGIEVEMAESVQ
jgi:hypothetical protein